MTIDWEAGQINDEQQVLRPEQVMPISAELEAGEVVYVDADDLAADTEGLLWLSPHAVAYNYQEAKDIGRIVDMARIVRLEQGFIVDASTGSYKLDGNHDRVEPDRSLNVDGSGWLPVVGLVENDTQREALARILFKNYEVIFGESALSYSVEPDQAPGPGEEDSKA